MADLSKLSIAPNPHDQQQQHQSMLVPQSRGNCTVIPDITPEFFVATSGQPIHAIVEVKHSPDSQ